MDKLWKYIILASAVVLSAMVLAAAYTSKSRNAGTISVVGLGETEFVSDLIVINGRVEVANENAAQGYAELEAKSKRIAEFLISKGVSSESISFAMPSISENYEEVYSEGFYVGRRQNGYSFYQLFSIESKDVDIVETAARELPSLLTEGVNIEVDEPLYYYSQLDAVKHDLIAAAAADARERALKIATSSEAELGELYSSSAGVFQITSATGNEEYSWGGSFNLSSRDKKARITIHANYKIR
jgi:hypothetical protein